MNKGQMSMDVLVAITVSIIVVIWLQGFLDMRISQSQELGLNQEAHMKSSSIGTVMNDFYALNTGSGAQITLGNITPTNFTQTATYEIEKETGADQLTLNLTYEGKSIQYTYPVPPGIEKTDCGGGICVES